MAHCVHGKTAICQVSRPRNTLHSQSHCVHARTSIPLPPQHHHIRPQCNMPHTGGSHLSTTNGRPHDDKWECKSATPTRKSSGNANPLCKSAVQPPWPRVLFVVCSFQTTRAHSNHSNTATRYCCCKEGLRLLPHPSPHALSASSCGQLGPCRGRRWQWEARRAWWCQQEGEKLAGRM